MEFMNIVSLSSPSGRNLELKLNTLAKGIVLPLTMSHWIVLTCINLLELCQAMAVEFIQCCLDVPFLTKLEPTVALTAVYEFLAFSTRSTITVRIRGDRMFFLGFQMFVHAARQTT